MSETTMETAGKFGEVPTQWEAGHQRDGLWDELVSRADALEKNIRSDEIAGGINYLLEQVEPTDERSNGMVRRSGLNGASLNLRDTDNTVNVSVQDSYVYADSHAPVHRQSVTIGSTGTRINPDNGEVFPKRIAFTGGEWGSPADQTDEVTVQLLDGKVSTVYWSVPAHKRGIRGGGVETVDKSQMAISNEQLSEAIVNGQFTNGHEAYARAYDLLSAVAGLMSSEQVIEANALTGRDVAARNMADIAITN